MKILMSIFMVFFALNAGAYVEPLYKDIKLATQNVMEYQIITAPIAESTTLYKTAQASSASVTTTVSTFNGQPDFPRNVTVTTGGTTNDCAAGNIVVTGKNIKNKVITESIAIEADQTGTVLGAKAFKSVSSILIPIQDGAACTYSFGSGIKFGFKNCLKSIGHIMHMFHGVTLIHPGSSLSVADDDEVEKNTFTATVNVPNGSNNYELFFMQNFRCQ